MTTQPPARRLLGKELHRLDVRIGRMMRQSNAHRELEEETGLRAGRMRLLTNVATTPGFCTERIGLYLATELTQHEDHPDSDEFLHVERLPLAEAVGRVMSGELRDAKTALGLLMAWQALGH